MKTRHILLLTLSAAVLAACGPTIGELKPDDTVAFGQSVKRAAIFHGLIIQVSDAESELLVRAPENMRCSKADRKILGCLYVRRGYTANIPFKLHADDIATWSFTEFSICRGKTKSTGSCTLVRAETREFDARISKNSTKLAHLNADGVIDLTQLAPDLTEFVLHDQNSHRQNYFYRITACKNGASPPKCASLDPGVTNRGL